MVARTMQEYIRYANQGATRNKPLSDKLAAATQFLGPMGITMEVFSGGQDGKGEGDRRTGSVRHDHGNAADVVFYKDGRKLDWANAQDRPIFQEIVRQGRANGITGFGAGPGYMQPGSMHLGFGSPAIWGRTTTRESAPGWLVEAFEGAPAGSVPDPVQTASVAEAFTPPVLPDGAQLQASAYAPPAAAPALADAFTMPDARAMAMASPPVLAQGGKGTIHAPSPVAPPPSRTSAVADLFVDPTLTPSLGSTPASPVQVAEGQMAPSVPQTAVQSIADVFGEPTTPLAQTSTPMAAASQAPATSPASAGTTGGVADVFGEERPVDIPMPLLAGIGGALGLGAAFWPGMDEKEAARVNRLGSIGGVTKIPDSVRRLTSG